MKRFIKLSGSVAVAIVAGALLAGTVMAAPPVPQGSGIATTPGAGIHQNAGYGLRGAPAWAGFQEEVATFLGLTEEQIQAERLAGKSLVQIAQAKGKTEADLVNVILSAKKADLDKALTDGTISREQAELMYDNMEKQVPQMVNRTTTGPASGQGRGAGNQTGTRQGGRGASRWASPTN